MRFNDALIGAALIALAAAVFLYARTLPAIPGQQYGAAVFPMLVAFGLAGCGVALAISGARNWEGGVQPAPWMREPASWFRLGLTFALILLYIFGADRLGFMPVAFVILAVMITMLGGRWWIAVPVAALVTLVVAKSFGSLLLVPLPRGFFWL